MPEVNLAQALFLVGFALLPPMIYLDATSHRIGRNPTVVYSVSAGAWALLTMIAPVSFLIACGYAMNRNEMIQQAQFHPVAVPRKRQIITFLLMLAASSIITPYWWMVIGGMEPG
jgi:hypothetical protein